VLDEAEHHVPDQRGVDVGAEDPGLDSLLEGLHDGPRGLPHHLVGHGLGEVAVRLECEQGNGRIERVALVELQVGLDHHAKLLPGIADVVAEVPETLELAPRVALGDREEHLLLRLEVLVERRLGGARGLADRRDGGGLESLAPEEIERRLEDAKLALGVPLSPIAVDAGGILGTAPRSLAVEPDH
jgi:hypothetical protein